MDKDIFSSRILLVDDDKPILDLLTVVLKKEGFQEILTATSGNEALFICERTNPDLIVLDVMLPDYDGFDLCHELRKKMQIPIMFLTAKTTDLNKLTGFSYGADDYITKPFNPLEVVARMKVHLRRHKQLPASVVEKRRYDFGRFQVDEESGQLIVEGKPVKCRAKELQLLVFLCQHPNRIFSKNTLYEKVWGEKPFNGDNTVMVHIRHLREKIEEDPSHPRYIQTIRGLGYKLAYPPKGD
nr:response regulator transcription factor [Polycladomyces sp. WAk]